MDAKTFREFGKAAVDYIADYMENIRDCDVLPSVQPGYLYDLLPGAMPEKPENWKDVMLDMDRFIKPGLTHWQSPHMHAYYPATPSYPSMVGDFLANGFNVIGLSWIASPACTELEVIVMDWLAKFLKLPEQFLHSHIGPGGGIINGTATESILVALVAARELAVKRVQLKLPNMSASDIRGKLVTYCSDQTNYIMEKVSIIAAIPIRMVPVAEDCIFNGKMLAKILEEDISQGLIPMFCIATLGTTGTCAFDDIHSLAEVCQLHQIWLHVDAAYAGAALALNEFKFLRKALDRVDSLNVNVHKSLLVNANCVAMWLKDANKVVKLLNIERIYLQDKYAERQNHIPEFRHWQMPLTRRFQALKVWMTFRTIGAEGLRAHVRQQIALAERFENYVLADLRFEIVTARCLGLVCFRPKGTNQRTLDLLHRLNARRKIFLIQADSCGRNFLRFVICGMDPKEEDIDFAWNEIQTQMRLVLAKEEFVDN